MDECKPLDEGGIHAAERAQDDACRQYQLRVGVRVEVFGHEQSERAARGGGAQGAGVVGHARGRGLHSSTSQLNLSLF